MSGTVLAFRVTLAAVAVLLMVLCVWAAREDSPVASFAAGFFAFVTLVGALAWEGQ